MSHRAVFLGVTMLAACACGTSVGLASFSTALGFPLASGIFYAALVGLAAAIFVYGIRGQAQLRVPVLLFLAALLGAGLLAPPRIMSDSAVHQASHLFGFFLYFAAAGFMIWAIVRLYSAKSDGLTLLGLGAAALAVGCTCCLTPGAVRYTVLATGIEPSWLVSRFMLVAISTLAGSYALYRAGLNRYLPYFWGGIAMVYPIEKFVEFLVPTWTAGSLNLAFLLRYPVWLAGTGLIIYAASRLVVAPSRTSPSTQGS